MISIDLIIVGLFLVLTLAVGIYYGRGITTFQDYAVGNRKMSSTVITMSLIATIYGGRALNVSLNDYYRQGFYACIVNLTSPAALYLASKFVIVRMKEFVGHLSIAESMGSMYGSTVRMITGIFGIIMAIAILTAQLKVGLDITTILFPEMKMFSTCLAVMLTLLVIFYSTFGGARAVALTDVYQFLLFGLCFPILIFVLLQYAKNPLIRWQSLMNMSSFNISKVLTWNNELRNALAYFIWRSIFPFDPARIQRFYMASSVQQAMKIFNRTAMIYILLSMLFLSVAIVLHVGGHIIKPSQNVVNYIIQLAYFPGMRGILVTVIIALLMSTADSNLHAAAVLFTNDVWPVVTGSATCASRHALKVVRIASVCMGITSLFVVLHTVNIIQLLFKTLSVYGPAISVAFIIATCGFRPHTAAVLLNMGISIAIAVYNIYYKDQIISEERVFYSLIFSALILLIAHYLLPKHPNTGWMVNKDPSAWNLQNQEIKRWWKKRVQQLTFPFTKKFREIIYPKEEHTFILFGIYTIISTMVMLCYLQESFFYPIIYSYMAIMAIGTIIALYPACHSYRIGGNSILHWVWPGLLFVLLFIVPIQFVKFGHFSPIACAMFVLNMALSIVLLSLEASVGMLGVALLIHKYMLPYAPSWNAFLASYHKASTMELVFAVVLTGISMVGLGTYKYLRDRANAKLTFIELIKTYGYKITLESFYSQANWFRLDTTYGSKLLQEMGERLQEPYKSGQKKRREKISSFMKKLNQFSSVLLQRIKTERSIELNQKAIKPIKIEPVIEKAYSAIRNSGEPLQLLLRNQTVVTQLIADPNLFTYFLSINLWEISQCAQATDHMVTLTIADTALHYPTTQIDQAALALPALALYISTDTHTQSVLSVYDIADELMPCYLPKTIHQIYQVESRQIVQAHGGYTEITENESVLSCLYVFPVAGANVMHFKTYDPNALVAGKVAETPESLAQEKELVALLTTATTLTQEMVEQTIAFIKNAHGLVARKSGAPYYTHPMAVTKILLEVTKDPNTLLAGLLHDIVEDTPVTLNQLELMYGSAVASIVAMVTHYHTKGYRWKLEDAENKNRLDQCKDIRAVQVKLADRLHNTRTLYARKLVDQKRIAQDTMAFYIPWGEKNNSSLKWLREMSHTCQEILHRPG